jgi:hypothetical protein
LESINFEDILKKNTRGLRKASKAGFLMTNDQAVINQP